MVKFDGRTATAVSKSDLALQNRLRGHLILNACGRTALAAKPVVTRVCEQFHDLGNVGRSNGAISQHRITVQSRETVMLVAVGSDGATDSAGIISCNRCSGWSRRFGDTDSRPCALQSPLPGLYSAVPP